MIINNTRIDAVNIQTRDPFYLGIIDIETENDEDGLPVLGVFWSRGELVCLYLLRREFLVWEADMMKRYDYMCKNCWHSWRSWKTFILCPKCKSKNLDKQVEVVV